MKKLLAFALAICMLFSLTGCSFITDLSDSVNNIIPDEKTFEFEGVSIKLNTDFLRMEFVDEDYDFIVGDGDVTVMGQKVPLNELELEFGDIDAKRYAELCLESLAVNYECTELSEHKNIPYFEYVTGYEDDEKQINLTVFYETSDAFLIMVFAFSANDAEKLRPISLSYAETVSCVG